MNNIWRHYKGGRYLYLNTATHCDTQEKLVIYKSLSDGKIWCRPEKEFMEILPDGQRRFQKEEWANKLNTIEDVRTNISHIMGMSLAEPK